MRYYVMPECVASIGYYFEAPVGAWWPQLQQSIWETMRDQINGQLYDAWRTDCDSKQPCGFGVCRGICDECQNDDYTHGIIAVEEDAAYERYEDRLAD